MTKFKMRTIYDIKTVFLIFLNGGKLEACLTE